MDEIKNAAETSVEAQGASNAVGENAGADEKVIAASSEGAATEHTDASFTDKDKNTEGKGADVGTKKNVKGVKSSEYAERRREAERQAAIKEAREKAIIEALGGINPYTEEEMKDSADVEEFLIMQSIKKNGGDPIADFAKARKESQRKDAEVASERERKQQWFNADREQFVSAYPDVDINALVENESFRDYAEGKVGNLPLKTIYERFLALTSAYEEKANARAAQMVANAKASPGALASAGESGEKYFTREEVNAMNDKQINDNYELIRKSMKKWNK